MLIENKEKENMHFSVIKKSLRLKRTPMLTSVSECCIIKKDKIKQLFDVSKKLFPSILSQQKHSVFLAKLIFEGKNIKKL